MSERTFLVAIDAWNANHDVSLVKDFIKTSHDISDWWNYIPYVFILATSLGPDELTAALKPYTKDAGLLVIEAYPGSAQGLLPESAWKWLDRRSRMARPENGALTAASQTNTEPVAQGALRAAFVKNTDRK